MNGQIGNVQLMQKLNRLKVLNCIRKNPYIVRPAVAEQTGLSLATITNIVSFLMEKGLVAETGFENAERIGRKAILLRFCPAAYYLICVTISSGNITVTLTDLDGNKISVLSEKYGEGSVNQAISHIVSGVRIISRNFETEKILAVSVAMSAFVLPDSTVAVASKLRWDRVDIKSELEKELNKPVFVIDTTTAHAHYCNENTELESRSLLFVDLIDGVGAVHFYEGHINKSFIGEIGHTTVEKDGDECFCKNRGCLEIMCSLERVVELYRKAGKGNCLDDVIKGYENGDTVAAELFEKAGEYLGIGMANAVNVLAPDTVIINAGEYLKCPAVLKRAELEARRRIFSALSDKVNFKVENIGEEGLIEGMAKSLCESIFDIDFNSDIF